MTDNEVALIVILVAWCLAVAADLIIRARGDRRRFAMSGAFDRMDRLLELRPRGGRSLLTLRPRDAVRRHRATLPAEGVLGGRPAPRAPRS